ncbi:MULTISPECIES: 23S rRNA (uracil(1939)-C(5))-methyltransferase RlmD [Thalassolituus]|uniref:TRAM domain-containing protein n=2 Tax=Pseudomonadota TaxID=1224 RepID=M5E0Z4_9GAMM|nr:23S rRNA (uracil(1939)-C(5))-methyltransferase RlmD [Thalassolituus oleivorans]CCU71364.1 hypothetical protein TOL_0928 [Thalassolituus oleivorans MIL-1]
MNQGSNGKTLTLTIDNMTSDGQGVARSGRDVYFVPGAIPGEQVEARIEKRSKKIWHSRLLKVITPSEYRVPAPCPHYLRCGGCDMQHMTYERQVEFKQDRVAREFARQGVAVSDWALPIVAEPWGYRRKARLGVRYSKEQNTNFVGFREGASHHISNVDRCAVLPDHPALEWQDWRPLLNSLDARALVTQIEVIAADNAIALVLRALKPLQDGDRNKLVSQLKGWQKQGEEAGLLPLQLWLRSEKDGEAECLWPAQPDTLHHFVDGMPLNLALTDFVQVNGDVNRAMVAQALEWLAPTEDERIWDLFAGHGNFSMPLARRSKHVVALEVQNSMVTSLAAQAEQLALPLQAVCADLSDEGRLAHLESPNAILLDPPRAGAAEVMQDIARRRIPRVLYVSCDAATLARDLNVLSQQGYAVTKAGIMDMFPQTHHVETMVLLEYQGKSHG